MIRWNAVWSVLWRNVQGYFSGVLGYLVIVVFVTVAAFCAFSPRFFANNLANLDQLSVMFPFLLLLVVPAITMGTWAEEKKQGTDEILFTLPMSDLEVLIGKYLSVLAIYTIVLAFSLTQLFALAWIGNPDWGVVFTTYFGYWLAGAALLSVGMFASVLTGNTTVAYVLGVTFCAIPVMIGMIAPGSNLLQGLSLSSQLSEFTSGLIPLTGIIYFVGLTMVMLYLNLIFISRRHWATGQGTKMGLHFFTRAIALAVAFVAVGFIASKSTAQFLSRIDATQEGLFTLSDTTRKTITKAKDDDRQVTVQAFLTPDVPREFVNQRKQLNGLLRQYDRIGGGNVDVRMVEVQPNSDQAAEARLYGISPVKNVSEVGGKQVEQEVFMGAVVTSDMGEVVLPFIDADSSTEYELTRALSTVTSRDERLKIGILETDMLRMEEMQMFRTFDQLLERLKEHYKLINVSTDRLAEMLADDRADKQEADGDTDEDEKSKSDEPDSAEDAAAKAAEKAKQKEDENKARAKRQKNRPDVLLVVQPSSLTRPSLDSLTQYVEKGNPTLLLADPLPFFPFVALRPADIGVINAPLMERPTPDSGLAWVSSVPEAPVPPQVQMQLQQMQQQLGQMPPQFQQQMMENFYQQNPQARPRFEPKGDMSRLLRTLGMDFNGGRVVWDLLDPHPEFSIGWEERILGSQWPAHYGPRDNLQLFVADRDEEQDNAFAAFSSKDPISNGLREMLFLYAGTIRETTDADTEFIPLIRTSENNGVMNWNQVTESAQSDFLPDMRRILARPKMKQSEYRNVVAARVKGTSDGDSKVNAVFVADTDFVSDLFFENEKKLAGAVDNLNFLLNAIEVLAGDDSLVKLRNRRPKPHRLVAIQQTIDDYRRVRSEQQTAAETEMNKQLEEAKKRLKTAAKKIDENEELGFIQKLQMSDMESDREQRRFDLQREKLEKELNEEVAKLKHKEQQNTQRLENMTRFGAVALPALPALALGLLVLFQRFVGERSRVVDSRKRK